MKILGIKKERRKLKEVSSDSYTLKNVQLKAGLHPIQPVKTYQTDFP
jgi:hypothetical protein